MPTGYTAAIKDGISFEKFALDCARAFGACVMIRDEPGGGEAIPEAFTPSDYHEKAAQQSRERLASVLAISPQEREQAADEQWAEAEKHRVAMLAEKRQLRDAYQAMLDRVEAWKPPTADHDGLKSFMQSQIRESIDFDCGESFYATPRPKLTGEQWVIEQVASIGRDIEYHDRRHAEEIERTAGRTEWVKALRASLVKREENNA